MVKAQAKQTPDEKKESRKKTSSSASGSSKKKPDTGSWPCKMDGCTKVFAREADLKRHQRTTKTHSIPGFQCPQCDATFTRTDALRRHQKSRHNGVVIEPEQDKSKQSVDGGSSGSRSPSPGGTPARSVAGDGSTNGSPPSSHAESSARGSGYYRPHTVQDAYYANYPPHRPPPPGMMIDPHYPPPPMGIPTSATRGNWNPSPNAAPWGAEGVPMPPPPGMYVPAYYPPPYYRPPGVHDPPHWSQINPELLLQDHGDSNGVGPPESALRNTSAETPKVDGDFKGKDAKVGESTASSAAGPAQQRSIQHPESSSREQNGSGILADPAQMQEPEGPDQSTLMAAAALQAVLAYQKEQEIREAATREVSASASAPAQHEATATEHPATPSGDDSVKQEVVNANASENTDESRAQQTQRVLVEQPQDGPSAVPVQELKEEPADLDAIGELDQEMDGPDAAHTVIHSTHSSMMPRSMDELGEEETPMLNPEELLTQESLASPPPS